MKRPTTSALLVATASVLLAGVATTQAGLEGHTVTADWLYPNFNSVLETHDVVVGAGVELPPSVIINDDKFSIDLSDAFIQFDFNATSNWTSTDFNGWRFSDTNGTIPEIIGYSIDAFSSGVSGLTNSDLGFDADSVWGNFAGITVAGSGDYIRLKVDFIPEPATLTLLAIGGLALCRRR